MRVCTPTCAVTNSLIKVKHPSSDIHRKIYITHEDKQYNSDSGSFPIVVIATFHIVIVTHVKYIFIGFEYPKNFKERCMVIQMM